MEEIIRRIKPRDAYKIINPKTSEKVMWRYADKEAAREQAFKIIRDLVEENTPKSPVAFKEEWGWQNCCPVCGEPVDIEFDKGRCHNCDQTLDWDDSNDDF